MYFMPYGVDTIGTIASHLASTIHACTNAPICTLTSVRSFTLNAWSFHINLLIKQLGTLQSANLRLYFSTHGKI